ncbi:hypothetical protein U2261_25750 [Achromobacter xylosoxidans]|jgi:hypothetical protein|uniref:hypothetical protein n=1 Tax=Achromobacter TaxID=222 RepID=UPI0006C12FD8|nr:MULTISPECIES: hypothetical protein [Achromobacter]MDZ5618043.1 hypothetical protein [Achromobacter xylosoxidans]MDZ5625868.1 hypothetical protein [Achromobacter xylosoxidans]MDZ5685458.1 hypothetical protein [Achromobacter xylosoxidans]CUJ70969.1 Uncharacterised protein [Achromobacter sp. 2789STDY5608621]
MIQATSQGGAQEARTRMAYKIMQQVYQDGQAKGLPLDQIHLAIRDAYPWGERRAWPYKAWLLARREFYEKHGLPLRPRTSIAESVQEGRT